MAYQQKHSSTHDVDSTSCIVDQSLEVSKIKVRGRRTSLRDKKQSWDIVAVNHAPTQKWKH